MTALTGRTSIPLEPGPRKTGAKVLGLPEASAATYPAGCLVIKSAGYIQMHTTGSVSTDLYGVAAYSGGSGSADGAKKAKVFRFTGGKDDIFKGVLSGTFAATNRGATAALVQNTAGAVVLVTAASASDSSAARIIKEAPGFTVGDVNPVVYWVPLSAKVQEG
jgi:hypothetical protein